MKTITRFDFPQIFGKIKINKPGWRNGLRRGLKILDPNRFVGSNPTPGTQQNPAYIGGVLL